MGNPGRKRKKKKNKLRILVVILVLLILGAVGLFLFIDHQITGNSVDIVDQEEVDPTAEEVLIGKEEQKDDQVYNVLLVGTDSRDPDADMGRSDSMMLISFNQGKGKATIVSFLRDCLVDIDGHGKSRLGHTYAYGGVGLTINTLNEVFDLDIQKYITINFDSLVNVIDGEAYRLLLQKRRRSITAPQECRISRRERLPSPDLRLWYMPETVLWTAISEGHGDREALCTAFTRRCWRTGIQRRCCL